jgi:hypothetical protein
MNALGGISQWPLVPRSHKVLAGRETMSDSSTHSLVEYKDSH